MADASEWDLLSSNESGSDVYWPESEFGDTISESLGFTDDDFTYELGDLTDSEVQHDSNGQFMRDDVTLIDENPSEIDTFPWTPDQQNDTPSSRPSSQAHPASSAMSASEIVEGMASLLETAVCTIIDLLNTPQKLSECEFVKSLLEDMEWDCEKLKDNAQTCTSVIERLNSPIARIVDCVATVTVTDADLSSQTPNIEVHGSDPRERNKTFANTPGFGSGTTERQSEVAVPKSQQHPEPTDPTTVFSAPHSLEIIQSLRENHNNFVCKCPSPCRSHPSVFWDNFSPSSNPCMKEWVLERVDYRCDACSEGNGLRHQRRRNNESKEWKTMEDVVLLDIFVDRKARKGNQEETDPSWRLDKDYLDGCEKNVEDSWEKVQRFLEEETKKVSGMRNTTSWLPWGDARLGATYWDPEEKLWKKGMMALG